MIVAAAMMNEALTKKHPNRFDIPSETEIQMVQPRESHFCAHVLSSAVNADALHFASVVLCFNSHYFLLQVRCQLTLLFECFCIDPAGEVVGQCVPVLLTVSALRVPFAGHVAAQCLSFLGRSGRVRRS